MAKWKRIGESDFFLKSDKLNWTVAQRIKCKTSNSHPEGYKYVHETYHSDLAAAFQRIFDETVRLADVETIEELLEVCKTTHKMLKRVLKHDFEESNQLYRPV
jgi:hypothetical protein